MNLLPIIIPVLFFSYFFFGRVLTAFVVVFFTFFILIVSIGRSNQGKCLETWVIDAYVPLNLFCEVKNELPKKSK